MHFGRMVRVDIADIVAAPAARKPDNLVSESEVFADNMDSSMTGGVAAEDGRMNSADIADLLADMAFPLASLQSMVAAHDDAEGEDVDVRLVVSADSHALIVVIEIVALKEILEAAVVHCQGMSGYSSRLLPSYVAQLKRSE